MVTLWNLSLDLTGICSLIGGVVNSQSHILMNIFSSDPPSLSVPAVVGVIQHFALDRENGKQLITVTNAHQVSTSLKFRGAKDE